MLLALARAVFLGPSPLGLTTIFYCLRFENAYRIMVGKPEGKRPLRRQRRKWADNIKMDLRGVGWGGMDWIHLDQDRDQWMAPLNTVMNLRVP
jgi:hypothetical protein